eukprot:g68256.t1
MSFVVVVGLFILQTTASLKACECINTTNLAYYKNNLAYYKNTTFVPQSTLDGVCPPGVVYPIFSSQFLQIPHFSTHTELRVDACGGVLPAPDGSALTAVIAYRASALNVRVLFRTARVYYGDERIPDVAGSPCQLCHEALTQGLMAIPDDCLVYKEEQTDPCAINSFVSPGDMLGSFLSDAGQVCHYQQRVDMALKQQSLAMPLYVSLCHAIQVPQQELQFMEMSIPLLPPVLPELSTSLGPFGAEGCKTLANLNVDEFFPSLPSGPSCAFKQGILTTNNSPKGVFTSFIPPKTPAIGMWLPKLAMNKLEGNCFVEVIPESVDLKFPSEFPSSQVRKVVAFHLEDCDLQLAWHQLVIPNTMLKDGWYRLRLVNTAMNQGKHYMAGSSLFFHKLASPLDDDSCTELHNTTVVTNPTTLAWPAAQQANLTKANAGLFKRLAPPWEGVHDAEPEAQILFSCLTVPDSPTNAVGLRFILPPQTDCDTVSLTDPKNKQHYYWQLFGAVLHLKLRELDLAGQASIEMFLQSFDNYELNDCIDREAPYSAKCPIPVTLVLNGSERGWVHFTLTEAQLFQFCGLSRQTTSSNYDGICNVVLTWQARCNSSINSSGQLTGSANQPIVSFMPISSPEAPYLAVQIGYLDYDGCEDSTHQIPLLGVSAVSAVSVVVGGVSVAMFTVALHSRSKKRRPLATEQLRFVAASPPYPVTTSGSDDFIVENGNQLEQTVRWTVDDNKQQVPEQVFRQLSVSRSKWRPSIQMTPQLAQAASTQAVLPSQFATQARSVDSPFVTARSVDSGAKLASLSPSMTTSSLSVPASFGSASRYASSASLSSGSMPAIYHSAPAPRYLPDNNSFALARTNMGISSTTPAINSGSSSMSSFADSDRGSKLKHLSKQELERNLGEALKMLQMYESEALSNAQATLANTGGYTRSKQMPEEVSAYVLRTAGDLPELQEDSGSVAFSDTQWVRAPSVTGSASNQAVQSFLSNNNFSSAAQALSVQLNQKTGNVIPCPATVLSTTTQEPSHIVLPAGFDSVVLRPSAAQINGSPVLQSRSAMAASYDTLTPMASRVINSRTLPNARLVRDKEAPMILHAFANSSTPARVANSFSTNALPVPAASTAATLISPSFSAMTVPSSFSISTPITSSYSTPTSMTTSFSTTTPITSSYSATITSSYSTPSITSYSAPSSITSSFSTNPITASLSATPATSASYSFSTTPLSSSTAITGNATNSSVTAATLSSALVNSMSLPSSNNSSPVPSSYSFNSPSLAQSREPFIYQVSTSPRTVQLGVKPAAIYCDICNKNFTSWFSRKRHMKTHDREVKSRKINKCQVCGREYTEVGNLYRHLRNNHQIDTCTTVKRGRPKKNHEQVTAELLALRNSASGLPPGSLDIPQASPGAQASPPR